MSANKFLQSLKVRLETKKPHSGFYILLKKTIWWLLGLFSVLIGGLSMAFVFLNLINHRLLFGPLFGLSKTFFLILPYGWVLLVTLFVFLARVVFLKTDKLYKLNTWKLLLTIFIISLLLGVVFYYSAVSFHLERKLNEHIPGYGGIEMEVKKYWHNPEKGRLLGEVVSANDSAYKVLDHKGTLWSILIAQEVGPVPYLKLNTVWRFQGSADFKNKTFLVCRVLPVIPAPSGLKKHQYGQYKGKFTNGEINLESQRNNNCEPAGSFR